MRISTSAGPARAELDTAEDPPFLLVLTHGAGGGTDSADLLAARQAGLDVGAAVARVLQPYRVRGARAPGSAARQDQASRLRISTTPAAASTRNVSPV